MDFEQQNDPFHLMGEETAEHLAEVLPRDIGEINEYIEVVHRLEGKINRRMHKIHKHMQTCGKCLNQQMKRGLLLPIEDYYKAGPMMGAGRLPKLHHMVN